MPFLGNRPAENYISYDVQHFTTSATTSYTLDHAVANENELRLVINNVVQQPGSSYAYSASGTSLTLTSATSATDTMYCVYLGKATSTVNPPNSSVTNATLSSGSFSNITGVGTLSSGLTLSDNILFDTASKGIYLGVTSATASNLLDDYEEGTFTPVLSFGGGTTGLTYEQQFGGYTKIGNVVHLKMRIKLSSKGSSTGDAVVNGFPFLPADDFSSVSFEKGKEFDTWTGMNTASNYRFVHTESNDMQIKRIDTNAVQSFATTVSHNDFTDTSDMRVTYTYTT